MFGFERLLWPDWARLRVSAGGRNASLAHSALDLKLIRANIAQHNADSTPRSCASTDLCQTGCGPHPHNPQPTPATTLTHECRRALIELHINVATSPHPKYHIRDGRGVTAKRRTAVRPHKARHKRRKASRLAPKPRRRARTLRAPLWRDAPATDSGHQ